MAYENLYSGNNVNIEMEHLYTFSSYATFSFSVKVQYFSGFEGFCLHTDEIDKILLKISELLTSYEGLLIINDTESDSFLKFEFENRDVNVSGQFGGSYNENFFRFKFKADYTIFFGLRECLKKY